MDHTMLKSPKPSQEKLTPLQVNYHFYKECSRLKIAQAIIKREIEYYKSQIDLFKDKEGQQKLLKNLDMLQSDSSQRGRRKRRTAVEIERKYK
mmetsp:Transcript_7881/g.7448  ORF Transcript_7881/g.7448 Transcript_7881/m.7448 type:complete len:93 (-) Transcript_7881:367-645(-)